MARSSGVERRSHKATVVCSNHTGSTKEETMEILVPFLTIYYAMIFVALLFEAYNRKTDFFKDLIPFFGLYRLISTKIRDLE